MFSFMTKSAKQTISAPLTRATETSRCSSAWLLWPWGLRWRLAASDRVPDLQRLLSNPFALLFGSPARRHRSLYPMPTQKSLIGVRVPASAEFVGAFTNPKAARFVYRYSILPRIVSVIAFDPAPAVQPSDLGRAGADLSRSISRCYISTGDMRMLDADAEGADWREVARIVLRIDPPSRAISPAPDGRRGMDTGTCFAAAGLALMPDKG